MNRNSKPFTGVFPFLLLTVLLLPGPVLAEAPGSTIQETVTIDGHQYPVPEPWHGHKIEGPSWLPVPPLVAVPRELVENKGAIYLLPAAREAFVAMSERAKQDGIILIIDSGYRSAHYQRKVYHKQMEEGKTFAEVARYVAPPGYSEHMLGLAVDFSPSDWRFAETPAYAWLKIHAGEFSFRETYPESRPDHQPWEPSHWRYIGTN
jgi:D-alanyl-D-alanine carboxypeptidase